MSWSRPISVAVCFFFNDTATTEIYTLPYTTLFRSWRCRLLRRLRVTSLRRSSAEGSSRSEEHTSELQSRVDLVCRLLLEKTKTPSHRHSTPSASPGHPQPKRPPPAR